MSDPNRLRQILWNVAGNAIKFTEQGTVELIFRLLPPISAEGTAILECVVKDSGPGISEYQAERLFQPFSQGDSSISRRYGGTGLGLFLSRQLAQLLNGELILVNSTLGKGSTFVLTVDAGDYAECMKSQNESNGLAELPLSPEHLAQEMVQLGKKYPVSLLVVDDNAVNRRLMTQMLERIGYHDVATAADGELAISITSKRYFDIIFMDLQMPNLDGLTASQSIRKLYSKSDIQPVIIALTAHAMSGDKETCLAAGMDDFVTKPIDFALLIDKLTIWASHVLRNRTN